MEKGIIITLAGTLISAVLTAGMGFWAVVWATGKQREINTENRIQDKKQELIVALDVWESLLVNFQSHIKFKKTNQERDADIYNYTNPYIGKLNLCFFLMNEYNFVSRYLANQYFYLSTMILYLYVLPEKAFFKYIKKMQSDIGDVPVNEFTILLKTLEQIFDASEKQKDNELEFKQKALEPISTFLDKVQIELYKELHDKKC